MSNNSQNQDRSIEKIHNEENLTDKNDYNISDTLSDSDLSEQEED